MGRESGGERPSRRSKEEWGEDMPRAAERRKVRSGRERVEVSSLGMMYCILMLVLGWRMRMRIDGVTLSTGLTSFLLVLGQSLR